MYYCSDAKDGKQNGVMTLKVSPRNINDIFMKGTYYEINPEREQAQGFYPFGSYELYKIRLPLKARLAFSEEEVCFRILKEWMLLSGSMGAANDLQGNVAAAAEARQKRNGS